MNELDESLNSPDDLQSAPSDIVTMTQLGKALKVSQPTIRHYITKGMPYITEADRKKGIAWEFSLSECLEWFEDQEATKQAKALDPEEDAGIIAARIAKLNVETERLQLRLARERGELVPIEKVADIVENQFTTLRTHLLALPVKLAPLVTGHTDTQEVTRLLTSYIKEALEELAEDKVIEAVEQQEEEDLVHPPEKPHRLDEILGIENDDIS